MPDETQDYFGSSRTVGMPGALTPEAASAGTTIVDNFTDSDDTSLSGRVPAPTHNGNTWAIEGTVTIQSNRVKADASGNGAWIDLGTSDQDYDLVYNFGTANNWTWVTFARDATADAAPLNGYKIFLSTGTVSLKRMDAGVETQLASASLALALSTDHDISIKHNATTHLITVSINGFQVINTTDATPPTVGTYLGFYASTQADATARWDSVNAQELSGTTIECASADSVLSGEQATIFQAPTTIECASAQSVLTGSPATLEYTPIPSRITVGARSFGRQTYVPMLPEKRKRHKFTEEDIEDALDNWTGRF